MKLKVGESLGMKLQYSDHNNDRKDARKFLGARDNTKFEESPVAYKQEPQ